MKKQRYSKAGIIVFLILFTQSAFSQFWHPQLPPPVDIPIQNIQQETDVWCWAAVAQQIISYTRGPFRTPPQCHLVAVANNSPPAFCCQQYNPRCVRGGSLQQIQFLIGHYGGTFANYALPPDAYALHRTLASNHPVILQVKTGRLAAHVVVLRGMHFVQTPGGIEAMLHINDPLSHFTTAVPFSQIIPIWAGAIVVG